MPETDISRWAFSSQLACVSLAWRDAISAHRQELAELDFSEADDDEDYAHCFGKLIPWPDTGTVNFWIWAGTGHDTFQAQQRVVSRARAATAVRSIAWQCPQLYVLDLSGLEHVGDDCMLAVAAHCPALFQLDIEDCYVTDKGLAALARGCKQLSRLYVEGLACGGKMLAEVTREGAFNALTDLHLARCSRLRSSTIIDIVQNSPNLQGLDLTGYNDVNDHVLASIASHSNIERLVLNSCRPCNPQGIVALARCPALQELHMRSSALTHRSFATFLSMIHAIHTVLKARPTMQLTLPGRFAHHGKRIWPSPKSTLMQMTPTAQIKVMSFDSFFREDVEVDEHDDELDYDPAGHKGLEGCSLLDYLQQAPEISVPSVSLESGHACYPPSEDDGGTDEEFENSD